uniref:Uncharacterized protein n=1 Tax=Plectus sambesii TaxID=2011161 RepID=A0A914XBM9_9BILA
MTAVIITNAQLVQMELAYHLRLVIHMGLEKVHKNVVKRTPLIARTMVGMVGMRLYRYLQCPLSGCPAGWRGSLLWPVVAMRFWAMVDATGENRPACREGLSPVYSQLSCYQFPDLQRDEHFGWVRVALSGN